MAAKCLLFLLSLNLSIISRLIFLQDVISQCLVWPDWFENDWVLSVARSVKTMQSDLALSPYFLLWPPHYRVKLAKPGSYLSKASNVDFCIKYGCLWLSPEVQKFILGKHYSYGHLQSRDNKILYMWMWWYIISSFHEVTKPEKWAWCANEMRRFFVCESMQLIQIKILTQRRTNVSSNKCALVSQNGRFAATCSQFSFF